MKRIERKAFADLQEFLEYTRVAPLLYLHIFAGAPDRRLLDRLPADGAEEALVLLDVAEDRGFLRDTRRVVNITADREFQERTLADTPGLAAWAKGTLIDFTDDPAGVEALVAAARRFAFPPPRSPGETQRLLEEWSQPSPSKRRRRPARAEVRKKPDGP